MKLENKELIETWKSKKYDSKHKLNTSMKKVSTEVITDIDKGITIEQLDKLQKEYKLPIYHYQTQITIHGLFDELGWNYINGYKNVIQNKNKSIGIRWNAIDANKRNEIANKLRYKGFSYYSNSSTHSYMKVLDINKDNYQSKLEELQTLLKGFQQSNFYGNARLFVASYYGQKVLVLEVSINAIYENDIDSLYQNLNITDEFIAEIDAKDKAKREASNKEYEAQEKLEKQKKIALLKQAKAEIEASGKTLEPCKLENGYGINIDLHVYGNDNYYTYTVMYLYKEGRQKYPRMSKRSYIKTFKEVLEFIDKHSQGYKGISDDKIKYKPKAFKIK